MKAPIAEDYHYTACWSMGDQCFVSRCAEFPELKGCGERKDLALVAIKASVTDEVERLIEAGEPVPEPRDVR